MNNKEELPGLEVLKLRKELEDEFEMSIPFRMAEYIVSKVEADKARVREEVEKKWIEFTADSYKRGWQDAASVLTDITKSEVFKTQIKTALEDILKII